VQADKTTPVDQAIAGEIVAVAKTEDLHTGTSLGEVELPRIKFPTPMVGLAVAPKARGDETKLSGALHKITEEDKTVRLDHDQETKEMVLTGMSELHLQLLRERLKRRDKVEVETHEPKIPYRENDSSQRRGELPAQEAVGGSGQFGEVHIRMYPLPEGTKPEDFATKDSFSTPQNTHYHEKNNFLWVDTVVGGTIPGNFMPAIEKGFWRKLRPAWWPAIRCKHLRGSALRKGPPRGFERNSIPIRGPAGICECVPRGAAKSFGTIVENGHHGSGGQRGRRIERSVRAAGPDGRHGLGRRRDDDRRSDLPPGGSDDVRPHAFLDDRRQGSYTMEFSRYDVVPPRPAADYCQGEAQG